MSLHHKIKKICAKPPENWEIPAWTFAFKKGHLQARRDAANLALAAEAENDRLRGMLKKAREVLTSGLRDLSLGQDEHDRRNDLIAEIDKALRP